MSMRTPRRVCQPGNVVEIAISRQEVEKFDLYKSDRAVHNFRQQRFRHFMRLSNAFRRYNGVKLLASLGLMLFFIGALILATTSSFSLRIPYTENDTYVDFTVPRDLDGPFIMYAEITNFRVNYRNWMESRPIYFGTNQCGPFDSVDAALYVRPIETFPELNGFAKEDQLIPCGLTSITFFNDEFLLTRLNSCSLPEAKPETCGEHQITIAEYMIAPQEPYSRYALLPSPDSKGKRWINPLETTRFQGWQYSAFTSSFLLMVGRIRDFALDRGQHRINITKNLWPAQRFGAQKALRILKIGPMGYSPGIIGWVTLGWGLLLLITSLIFFWGVRRNIVFKSASLSISPEEVREQWILHTQEWLGGKVANRKPNYLKKTD